MCHSKLQYSSQICSLPASPPAQVLSSGKKYREGSTAVFVMPAAIPASESLAAQLACPELRLPGDLCSGCGAVAAAPGKPTNLKSNAHATYRARLSWQVITSRFCKR